ncbi:hypothetical protein, partial [Mycolicibacterium sp. CBMA 361]
ADTLYELLPAYLRVRDQAQGGGTLRALIRVVAAQAEVIDTSLDQQYDDQFIETCSAWAVPYIGDLIGFTPLQPLGPDQPSATRAEVADTIGYRRRKGTLSMLEQLCHDVTGWPGVAVEYFSRLSTTQYIRNHRRLPNTIVDVHSGMTAVDIGGPFDLPPRTADVRRIDTGQPPLTGRYNVPNIGVFVWRLYAYLAVDAPARQVTTTAGRYTFDPFGGDVPLVNPAVGGVPEFTLLGRADVPFFLQYYPLYTGVTPYAAAAAGAPNPPAHKPPLPIAVAVGGTPVDYGAIAWCDLEHWTAPQPGIGVSVDPQRGRLVLGTAPPAGTDVTVGYAYAFSGAYGGGHYTCPVPADDAKSEALMVPVTVPSFAATDLSTFRNELVEIADSGLFVGNQSITPDANLLVVTAGDNQRPVITGDVSIVAVPGATVRLRGLGVGGTVTVTGAGPFTLDLQHCTIRGGIDWSSDTVSGQLTCDHSLIGPLAANSDVAVIITDSAVDAGADTAAAISGGAGSAAGAVTITTSTVLGAVTARTIPLLSDSIVTGAVVAAQRQSGCVRYSFTPAAASQTPPRFRCQPDLEVATEVAAALRANPALTPAQRTMIQNDVESWLVPVLTSRTPGQPAYLQLADTAPAQIRFGAEQEDEMGVYNKLFSGRRERNLSYRINEYLRIGLSAGIIHAT